MITLANTKSISRLKAERRFSFSAASLHTKPMPSSMPTLTMKLSSARSRSRNPAGLWEFGAAEQIAARLKALQTMRCAGARSSPPGIFMSCRNNGLLSNFRYR